MVTIDTIDDKEKGSWSFKENILALIAFFDLFTPKRILVALLFLQPLFDFTKSAELNFIRHISLRLITIWLLLFAVWLITRKLKNVYKFSFGVEKALGLYILTAILSSIYAFLFIEIDTAKVITSLFTLPLLLTIAYLFPFYFDKKNDYELLFKGIIYSLAFVSVYGILQYFLGLATLTPGFRISSVFHDPNIFSRYILIGSFFVISHLLFSKKHIISKTSLIIILIISLGCLFLTFSRSGYATFFIVLIIFLFFHQNKKLKYIIIPPIILISIAAFIFLYSQRVFVGDSIIEESSFNRIQLIFAGLDMISNNWFTGIGYTNFPFIYSENYVVGVFQMSLYQYEMLGGAVSIHNWFVEVWAELGIFGLIAFLWFFIVLLKKIKRAVVKTSDEKVKSLLVGSYMMILIFLLHGFFYHTFISQFFFWIMLGVVFVLTSLVENEIAEKVHAKV